MSVLAELKHRAGRTRSPELYAQAAAEIGWLTAENERLRAALTKIADPLLIKVEGTGTAMAVKLIRGNARYCARRAQSEQVIKMDAVDKEAERDARLVESMRQESPWSDQPWARVALTIAARAIRRGRHLTEAEKLLNLADAMEDDAGDTEEERAENRAAAAKIREIATR